MSYNRIGKLISMPSSLANTPESPHASLHYLTHPHSPPQTSSFYHCHTFPRFSFLRQVCAQVAVPALRLTKARLFFIHHPQSDQTWICVAQAASFLCKAPR